MIKFLLERKSLRKLSSSTAVIYEDENNADKIKILCPQFYDDYDLQECSVMLNYIIHTETDVEIPDSDGGTHVTREIGNSTSLSFFDEKYIIHDEEFLQTDISLSNNFTAYAGTVEFWIEIMNPKDSLIAKTNIVTINITPHKSVSDYIPESELSLLNDLMLRIQQLLNTCNITLEECKKETEKAVNAATIAIEIAEELEQKYGGGEV